MALSFHDWLIRLQRIIIFSFVKIILLKSDNYLFTFRNRLFCIVKEPVSERRTTVFWKVIQ
ncbi:MAG: hypothetical protein D8B57_08935 [Prevotella sp.]|nr:MAG: hypothetical protein D8B57_08935 [Prevotella sp.]